MEILISKSVNIRNGNFSINGTSNDLVLSTWSSSTPLNRFNDLKQEDLKTLIELLNKALEVCNKEYTIGNIIKENC